MPVLASTISCSSPSRNVNWKRLTRMRKMTVRVMRNPKALTVASVAFSKSWMFVTKYPTDIKTNEKDEITKPMAPKWFLLRRLNGCKPSNVAKNLYFSRIMNILGFPQHALSRRNSIQMVDRWRLTRKVPGNEIHKYLTTKNTGIYNEYSASVLNPRSHFKRSQMVSRLLNVIDRVN